MHDPADSPQPNQAMAAPVSEAARPDHTLAAIVLMAILALAAAFALLPSSGEKAEALLAAGRYGDAIHLLVGIEEQRQLDAYESYLLFKLYVLTEQPDSAAALIDDGQALQLEAIGALNQLTGLYRNNRDYVGEATVLRRLYDDSPNQPAFDRLRVLYRLIGDKDGESSLLSRGIAAGHASPQDRQRLKSLTSGKTSDTRSVVWADPSGSFSGYGPNPAIQALALSDLTAFPVNSRE